MKLGVENKKQVYALSALGVVAAVMVYTQLLSGPSPTTVPVQAAGSIPASTTSSSGPNISQAKKPVHTYGYGKNGDFHPAFIPKKKEDQPEVGTIDPSLRWDLLDKVLHVSQAGDERDLFTISKTPPVKVAEAAPVKEVKLPIFVGPPTPLPPVQKPPDPPAVTPPPEPIPFKYFGYTMERPDGKRTAYFMMEGEDLPLKAIEGTTLKGRYLVVQIGLDKVLIEDKKQNRRQSVSMEPEVSG